jgi:hypothetical protein
MSSLVRLINNPSVQKKDAFKILQTGILCVFHNSTKIPFLNSNKETISTITQLSTA